MAATDLLIAEIVLKASVASGGGDATSTANVFHFKRDGTVNPWSAAAICTAFATAIGVPLKAALHQDAGSFLLSMRNVNDAMSAPVEQTMAGAGAIATERMPSYVSVCMHLKTGVRGKNYRGRKHFSPIAEADTTGDILTGAGLTRWEAVRDAILAGFTDADTNVWVPVVVSPSLSTLGTNPTTVIYTAVNSILLNTEVGTMKRRHA